VCKRCLFLFFVQLYDWNEAMAELLGLDPPFTPNAFYSSIRITIADFIVIDAYRLRQWRF